MRVLATVRCPVVQFNPVQQPVMAYGIVPKPDLATIELSPRYPQCHTGASHGGNTRISRSA